jgi:hypothetical protein
VLVRFNCLSDGRRKVEGLVVGEEFLAPRCAMVRAQTEAQAIITAQPLRRMAGTRNFLPGP